jgi:hypothetical protein
MIALIISSVSSPEASPPKVIVAINTSKKILNLTFSLLTFSIFSQQNFTLTVKHCTYIRKLLLTLLKQRYVLQHFLYILLEIVTFMAGRIGRFGLCPLRGDWKN